LNNSSWLRQCQDDFQYVINEEKTKGVEMAMLKKGAEKLLGVEAIMHTPFKENYELDLDGARKLVRHMIDNGIVEGNGCILVAGAVGEFMAMSPDERKQLAEVCLDEADGKVPMIINVADTNVNVIKELAHHAAEHGAYCVQLSPPYYTPLSDQELVDYYKDISDEISIGMMIYANYWASQVYFDNIIGELIQIENVVAFKWNHPDALVYHDVLIEYADKVAYYKLRRISI
jgi:dihydrodipicolinate synthase/N-acetylneuraminate lyase